MEESLRFHKFGFELDAELQWIKDHLPQASSTTLGQNLHQAQTLHKKHKKLEAEIAGHQSMIDKTLASGQTLIDQAHPEKKKVNNENFLCENDNFFSRGHGTIGSREIGVRNCHFCTVGASRRVLGLQR